MAKDIRSWKDCTDGNKVQKFASSNGLDVRRGKGDHYVMRHQSGASQTCYNGTVSTGVACKIFKFFKMVGLVSIPILLLVGQHFFGG